MSAFKKIRVMATIYQKNKEPVEETIDINVNLPEWVRKELRKFNE